MQPIPHVLMKLAFASLETLPVAKGGDKEYHLQRLLPTSLFLLPFLSQSVQVHRCPEAMIKTFEGCLNYINKTFSLIPAHEVNIENGIISQ